MNPIDQSLERLLRAAAQAPESIPCEAPFPLETRILAAWRSGGSEEPSGTLDPLLRRAFYCACGILLLAIAFSLHSGSEPPPNEILMMDSAIELTLTQ
jgi:hypothetical protein